MSILFVVAAAWAGVFVAGRATLPPPPLAHPGGWPAWYRGEGPVAALFSAARLVLLLAGILWALLLAAVVAAAACGRVGHADRQWRLARRGVWRAVLGLSASGAVMAGCARASGSAPGAGPSPPAPHLVSLGARRRAQSAQSLPPAAGSAPRPTGTPSQSPGAAGTGSARLPAPTRRSSVAAVPSGAGEDLWTVRSGDDLWSIAEATVKVRTGGADARLVARYWAQVVAANLDRLPDPNLIFPGQLVLLPPLEAS